MAKAWFLHKGAMDRDADILLMEHGWDRIASPDEFSMWRKQGDTGKMFVYPDGSWQFLSNLRRILAEGSDSESLKIYVSGQAKPIEHMGNSRLASNPVEYKRRKRAMPNIQTLEQKRRYDLGMQLTQLGKEVLQLNRVKDKNSISNKLNMIGGSFANGYANFSDTHSELENIRHQFTSYNDMDDVQNMNFFKKLDHTTQEFSTPRNRTVSKLYRAGSQGHGILQAIATRPDGCISKELKAYFPSLHDSSLLTHMRREGVIEKKDGVNSPWLLTEIGKELLNQRGAYTLDMYGPTDNYYYPGVKTLPWELPPADHAQFVADNGIKRFT